MNDRDAKDFVMPLGKYRGETLDDIGSEDEGIKYLDWIIGQEWIHGTTRKAIETFLAIPHVSRRVNELTD